MTGPTCQSRVYPFGRGWRLILGASGEAGAPMFPQCWGASGWGKAGGWWGEGGSRCLGGEGSLRGRLGQPPQQAVGRGWAGF